MNTRTQWKPLDYIVEGDFSPFYAIQQELESIRSNTGATMALLLVSYHDTFFDSVIQVAHQDPRTAASYKEALDDRVTSTTTVVDLSVCKSFDSAAPLLATLDQIGLQSCVPALFDGHSRVVPLCWN